MFPRHLGLNLLLAALAIPSSAQVINVNTAWSPVTDAERKMAAPVVDPAAGVEALFWRVHVFDEVVGGQDLQRVLFHYVRLKIFNEKGKEAAATIEIPYGAREGILNIAGRTIKADGTIVELQGNTVREQDVLRFGRFSRKAKAFAMPGVEPGAIVEYRWREIRFDPRSLHMRLQFQREFPVQKVTYFLKPLSQDYTTYTMSLLPFNCQLPKLQLDNQGFNFTSLDNVPAYKDEPMMPSTPSVRPWALVAYREKQIRDAKDVQKYWEDEGKESYRRLKLSLKINDEIGSAAAAAVAGTASDEEKVVALIRHLRKTLRGLYDRTVSESERKEVLNKLPKERYRTSAEILKSGIGLPNELNIVFAAMAAKIGLDARPALVADRDDVVFVPGMADSYFLPNVDMAVKIGEQWKIYDVSTRMLPANMVSWKEEGVTALISDPKAPTFVSTSISKPEQNVTHRSGAFKLSSDGTIEGTVSIARTGHSAAEERSGLEPLAEAKRLERIKDELLRVFPSAEVSDIKAEGVDDPEKALTISYRIKVAGYGQRTGKRLFFQPLVSLRGEPALFAAAERKLDIHFPHPWQDVESVSIELPEGYTLDNAENPGGIGFGPPGGYRLDMSTLSGRFQAERSLTFGNEGAVVFPVAAYPQLKKIFDEVHRRDSTTIALRQVDKP